jgi:hypothetical protein
MKAWQAIKIGVATTLISALLAGAGVYLWNHFVDTDGIRSDLDDLYGIVNEEAQKE